MSQEKLSIELGITRSRLGAYEENRSEPPIDLLIKLSDYFGVSIDALVRGDLSRNPQAGKTIEVGGRLLFPVQVNEQNNDVVELITHKASAGYLRGYSDPEYIEAFHQLKLPFLPSGKHRAFPIKGDSMPPLNAGSYVVGRFIERIDDIHNGQTYVLLTRNDGITYKRVQVNKEKQMLLLHSDNIQYRPFEVLFEDVLEIWEYSCAIHTKGYDENELNYGSILTMLKQLQVEVRSIKKNL